MSESKKFQVLEQMPTGLTVAGVHPETKMIIDKIKVTKGKVLAVTLKSARAAKIRLDALRRSRARKRLSYQEGRRQGSTLYFRLR